MKNRAESINEIKDLIGNDCLMEAIEKMQELYKESSFQNEITMIFAKLAEVEKRTIRGIISDSEYMLAKAKIRNSLIEALAIFETESRIKIKYRFLTPVKILALMTICLFSLGGIIFELEHDNAVGAASIILGFCSFIALLLALVVTSFKNKF